MQVIAAEVAPGDLSGLSFSPQVDLGHIYGDNLERQYQLRLFKDGKLKYQVALGLWTGGGGGLLWSSLAGAVGGPEWWPRRPVAGAGGVNPGRRCQAGEDMTSHVILGGRFGPW